MLAITLKVSKKISFRAALVSVCAFVFAAIIINVLPAAILENSLCKNAEEAVLERAEEFSGGVNVQNIDNERVVCVDNFARVTYDSAVSGNLEGKYLINSAVRKALSGSVVTEAAIEEKGVEAYAAKKTESGAIFIHRTDGTALLIISDMRNALALTTLIVGVLFMLIINIGAYRTKKRIKALSKGINSGEYGAAIGNSEDEINELAHRLSNLSKQIEETEELRRTFVSDASHELRTPLSSIQLLVDSIIQTENIDMDTTREFMTDISEQIDRLTRIAERLLLLTNLDGAKDLSLEPVDMKKVAESVIATLEQSAVEAQVALNCNFADDVVFRGTTDGAYQIIFNLVENAIKYNRPGGVVRVYIFKNDGLCNLIVDDNGIGIPEKDFELIFERFYRVDKARSRDKGGSGLGLSIVSKIVGYFGGEIKVEQSVDGGTRFTVTFVEEVEE